MGSRNSDDPMDLGPFLQNYVMKNPFDQLHMVTNKEQQDSSETPLITEKTISKSESKNKLMPILPKPITEAPKETTNTPVIEKDSSKSETGDKETGSEGEPQSQEDQERDGSASPHSYIGGHVGSNVTYAINLRQNKVSDVHEEAQLWLWRGYKHIPSYKGLYSVNDLLSEMHQHFSHITSVVLSHIMKFTFPDCLKLTNKSGVYYQGLIAKPTDDLYLDEHLLAAASAVQNGRHTVESAAKTHYVSEMSVASLAFWEEEEQGTYPSFMTAEHLQEDDEPTPSRPSKRKSQRGRPSKKHREDDEWRPPVKVENGTPRRCPRLRASQRDKINTILRAESADSQEDSDMDARGGSKKGDNLECGSAQGSSRARKRKSVPLKTVSVVKSSRGNDNVSEPERQVCRRFPVLRNVLKTGEQPIVTDFVVGENNNFSDIPARDMAPGVQVKEEPSDCGYGDGHAREPLLQVNGRKPMDLTAESSRCDSPTVIRASSSDSTPATGAMNGNNASISTSKSLEKVNHLTLRMVLEKIHDQGLENKTLEEQLVTSRQEIQSLQGQLHSRDEQLAELANAFFSLNNQFQVIAHRFKMALSTNVLDRNLEDINEIDSPDDR